jgi:putative nucleotidyltransferase with HDIG domain
MITAIRNGESPWDEDEITEIPDKMPVIDNLHESEYYFNLEKTTKKYNETKAAAKELIDEARETGKVDRKQADEVSMGILRQVNETEASLIIRSINRIRSVDEYLHSHSLNVAYLNGLIGKWMKFDEKKESDLIETGLLHDIGKLMVAPEILNKPARLTTMEFDAIKKHPVYSLEMLEKSGVSKSVVLGGVIQHHEKVNGTGYPYGLDVKNITEFARITAISDIYDAMVTKRVYKDPHSPFEILNEFASEGYSELDIKYVSIFIDCMIEELKGKRVIMNDESIATVKLINPRNLLYPLVEVDGKAVETSDDFHCVRMYDGLR